MEAHFDTVWPLSPTAVAPQPLAPRRRDLENATVGFVWDYLFRGDELFPLWQEVLEARFPGVSIVPYDAFGNTHGPDESTIIEALPRRLRDRGVDAVVSGMGC